MTALLLAGLVRSATTTPADAPPHLRIAAGALTALATPAPGALFDDAAEEPPLEVALCHHRLLAAYALAEDVLPVRFGTAFSGEAGIRSALAAGGARWRAGLARLAGRVEYTLAVEAGAGPESRAVPGPAREDGRAFLAEKRSRRDDRNRRAARRAAFLADLPGALAGLAADQAALGAPRGDRLADLALLVERAAIPDLLAQAHALAERARSLDLRLALRGPGPCYAFAARAEEPADA